MDTTASCGRSGCFCRCHLHVGHPVSQTRACGLNHGSITIICAWRTDMEIFCYVQSMYLPRRTLSACTLTASQSPVHCLRWWSRSQYLERLDSAVWQSWETPARNGIRLKDSWLGNSGKCDVIFVASFVYSLVCLPLSPRFGGSNPDETIVFLRATKFCRKSSFGGKVKLEAQCCKYLRHVKEL
jgi:hypothetical protein